MKRNVVRHAVIQPQDQSIRLIALTQGQNAIVDTEDYDWLNSFTWKAQRDDGNFYARRVLPRNGKPQKSISMQQQILGLTCKQDGIADHIDGDTLNYRRKNLRRVGEFQNAANHKTPKSNKSGYPCVIWIKRSQRWRVQVTYMRRRMDLGEYKDKDFAIALAADTRRKLFGEYERRIVAGLEAHP